MARPSRRSPRGPGNAAEAAAATSADATTIANTAVKWAPPERAESAEPVTLPT